MEEQKRLIKEPGQFDKKHLIEELIDNPLSLLFIYDLPIISFFLANLVIFLIINISWKLSGYSWIITLFLGSVLALIIIKTNYFLNLSNIVKRIQKIFAWLLDSEKTKNFKLPNISVIEALSFAIRNFFFNLLNDAFILLIFWLIIYALFICIRLAPSPLGAPPPLDFRTFSELIALIGVLSGLFQFYVQEFKIKSKDVINSLIKERLSSIGQINFIDFKNFLLRKNHTTLVDKINSIIYAKRDLSKGSLVHYAARKEYRIYETNIFHIIGHPVTQDDIKFFTYFEELTEKATDFRKDELLKCYIQYFKEKEKEIKRKTDKNRLLELRKILLTTIVFSDDVLFSYLKLPADLPEKTLRPSSFKEVYENFKRDIVLDLFDEVLSVETHELHEKLIFGFIVLILIISTSILLF